MTQWKVVQMAMPQRDDPPTPRLPPALCAMADKSEDKYETGGEGVARQICRRLTKLLHDLHVLHGKIQPENLCLRAG